ncbi:MAG: ABC transporter permease [Bacteroidales bacterium]|nr:ABC transporter permease [Bacteroidales bacterium]
MNKISLIIKREYLSRVKKKTFVVMTILGPLLMASLFVVPFLIQNLGDEEKTIDVVDETRMFIGKFEDSEDITFNYLDQSIEEAKKNFEARGNDALLYIPETKLSVPEKAIIYSDKQPGINVKSSISNVMENEIEGMKLQASGIDKEMLKSIKTDVNLTTMKLKEGGSEEKTFTEVSMGVGFVLALIIYFFIFMFGAQVMRGVIEEKTNRIVEVIVSSVKPFQLMMGKIVGVAMVGLTQVLLWVVLTLSIVSVVQVAFPDTFSMDQGKGQMETTSQLIGSQSSKVQEKMAQVEESDMGNKVMEIIGSINFASIIGSFIFFFLGGYLLYAALFAAIGGAVDNETDTQQFMLPITVPLIFAIIAAQVVVQNPNGSLSFWLSIIPFTSPVIMMIRIPFGVPYFDLILSAVLLILGFLATTWLAGKIYRTGILMYGSKVDYKTLLKWVRYGS